MKGSDGVWLGQTIAEEQIAMKTALEDRLQALNWQSLYSISPAMVAIQPMFGTPGLNGEDRTIFVDPFSFGQDTFQWSIHHMLYLLDIYAEAGYPDPDTVNQESFRADCRECGRFPLGLIGYMTISRHQARACPKCGLFGLDLEIIDG